MHVNVHLHVIVQGYAHAYVQMLLKKFRKVVYRKKICEFRLAWAALLSHQLIPIWFTAMKSQFQSGRPFPASGHNRLLPVP